MYPTRVHYRNNVTRPDLTFIHCSYNNWIPRASREQCMYPIYARHPSYSMYYHCNHSPYIFGLSARIYPSNDLFITVAQLKSTSSSISSTTVSVFSLFSESSFSEDWAFWASRNAFSPLMNRGPRSGKLREGSNGSHLLLALSADEGHTRNYGNGRNRHHGRTRRIQVVELRQYQTCRWRRRLRIW